VASRQFGVSTELVHGQRLTREHLLEIAAQGFESVEIFATRSHFDYHNPAAIADFQEWLAAAGLELHAIHAPVGESLVGGRWSGVLSLASVNPDARAKAVCEAQLALHIARRIPARVLVVHLGLPRAQSPAPEDNSRDAARRSIEELERLASPLGVRVAVEVIPNELSRVASLVHFIEEEVDAPETGVCLDFGHAHMDGDLLDAIEIASGHLLAVHVHDNRRRADEHLIPFDGTIDWPGAMTALQKVGYDRTLTFEVGGRGPVKDTLVRAQKARKKLERLLAD
jgi:sugar phosphate isomerase/epimerase